MPSALHAPTFPTGAGEPRSLRQNDCASFHPLATCGHRPVHSIEASAQSSQPLVFVLHRPRPCQLSRLLRDHRENPCKMIAALRCFSGTARAPLPSGLSASRTERSHRFLWLPRTGLLLPIMHARPLAQRRKKAGVEHMAGTPGVPEQCQTVLPASSSVPREARLNTHPEAARDTARVTLSRLYTTAIHALSQLLLGTVMTALPLPG